MGGELQMTLANGDTINYGYDNAYRLTSEVRRDAGRNVIYDDAITFDAVGNRTRRVVNGETTSYFYNANNQLTESAGTATKRYFYDRNGNQVRVVSPGEVEHYEFDELNRMTEYRKTGGGQPVVEQHQYRGAEWHRSALTAEGVTTKFLYDGDNVAADVVNGAVSRQYVTPFLDQNLSMTDLATGQTYYYSHDGLGSVRTLTNATGQIANKYDYNAWGEAHLPGTGVAVPQRYTYTGRENNPISPLMNFRYRTYTMHLGRFISKDPLGYVDGMGLYNGYFVPNGTDPMGLATTDEVKRAISEAAGVPFDQLQKVKNKGQTWTDGKYWYRYDVDAVHKDPHVHIIDPHTGRTVGRIFSVVLFLGTLMSLADVANAAATEDCCKEELAELKSEIEGMKATASERGNIFGAHSGEFIRKLSAFCACLTRGDAIPQAICTISASDVFIRATDAVTGENEVKEYLKQNPALNPDAVRNYYRNTGALPGQ